jgi:hypothetical protein
MKRPAFLLAGVARTRDPPGAQTKPNTEKMVKQLKTKAEFDATLSGAGGKLVGHPA